MSDFVSQQLTQLGPVFFYIALWVLIYIETAIVVAFFLPGDTVLFAAGLTIAATDRLNLWVAMIVISTAAIVGDNTAYVLGKKYGEKYISSKKSKAISNFYAKSQTFYAKYGVSTLFLARFYPWLRTLIPFSAGTGHMPYRKFWLANIAGGIVWSFGITSLGYFANELPVLKNSSKGIAGFFVLITIVLAIRNYLKYRSEKTPA